MGLLIERFRLQPFIVTLAGMFLARGLCYLISIDSISITDADLHRDLAGAHPAVGRRVDLGRRADRAGDASRSAIFVAHCTPSAAPSTRSAAASSRRC